MYTVMECVVKQMSLGDLKKARLLNQQWSHLTTKEIERRWNKLEPIMINLHKYDNYEGSDYNVDLAKLKEFRATLPGCTSLGLFPNFEIIGRNEHETVKSDIVGSSHLDQLFGELKPKMLYLPVEIKGEWIGSGQEYPEPSGLKLEDFFSLVRNCSETLKELKVTFDFNGDAQCSTICPHERELKLHNLEKIELILDLDIKMEGFKFGQMLESLGKGVGLPKLKIFSLMSQNLPTDLPESFARFGITEKLEELSLSMTITLCGESEGVISTLHKLALSGLNLKSFTIIFWELEFKNWSEYKEFIGGLKIFLETQSKSLQYLKIQLHSISNKFEFTEKMSTNLLDLSIFTKLKKININWPENLPKLISNASNSVNHVQSVYYFLGVIRKELSDEDFFPKIKKLTIFFPYEDYNGDGEYYEDGIKEISTFKIPNNFAETLETLILDFRIICIKQIDLRHLLKFKALRRLELISSPEDKGYCDGSCGFEPEKLGNNFISQLKELKIRSLVIRNFVISEAQEKILKENFEYSYVKDRSI